MGREPVLNKDLDAVISLNISHLHDAANFFALIKNQIERGEDLDELRKFSKGAAYHFRSLFEELKAKKELINNKNSIIYYKITHYNLLLYSKIDFFNPSFNDVCGKIPYCFCFLEPKHLIGSPFVFVSSQTIFLVLPVISV